MATAADNQAALTGYWQRLDRLNASDWEYFFVLVRQSLCRCPAPELASLPDTRENYIAEFFVEKIFYKAQRDNSGGIQSLSGGSLCLFFRRYLIGLIRAQKDMAPLDDAVPDRATPTGDLVDAFLSTTGHENLAMSVSGFLSGLEDWALLMLRGHFCAEEGQTVPMSHLCKEIPSYQYKAQKLGITTRKTDTYLGYEHTRIGQWAKSLGVEICPENYPVIKFLLEALCLEATARVVEANP